jgi:hypothetical protein
MINIDIPGRGPLELQHLVLDLNGTLSLDGPPAGNPDGHCAIPADAGLT